MMLPKFIIFCTCLFMLISCKAHKTQKEFPRNLDEAVLYFRQHWRQTELDSFKNKPESDAVTELHKGTGAWIRNTWIYGDRDTALTSYFKAFDIHAPDDISTIILRSLHRTLNKKDIQLDEQVEAIKAYWKPIIECNEKQKAKAVSDYNKFKKGDDIIIYMPVDTAGGSRNAFLFDCPTTEWTFDKSKDLLLKGTITKKYFINNTASVFFSVNIYYMSHKDTQILTEQVKIGDIRNFSLIGLRIQ